MAGLKRYIMHHNLQGSGKKFACVVSGANMNFSRLRFVAERAEVGDGKEVLRRLKALPGFGDQKARIFLALLGKQRGVTPAGWREVAGDYGAPDVHRSIADVTDADSLVKVRETKRAMKAAAKAAKG